jgi:hypothetical protein
LTQGAVRPPRPDAPLTWLGIGIGLVGVAVTLRPIDAPTALVWSILGLGGAALLGAAGLALRPLAARPGEREQAQRRALVASECRRLYDALSRLIEDFSSGQFDEARARELARSYREDFARWALRVFDHAFAAGAIDDCSRSLLEAPTATQLGIVRDLFRDAALALEQHP